MMLMVSEVQAGDYFHDFSSFPINRIIGDQDLPYIESPEALSGLSSNTVYDPISPIYQEIATDYAGSF
jgi:hypothetical protein